MPSIPSDLLANILIGAAILLFFTATAWLRCSIKVVPENKRVVIFWMGKCRGSAGPGLVRVIPIIERAVWVRLDKSFLFLYSNIPTADGKILSCSVSLEGKISDAEKSVLNVPNLEDALKETIESELKELAGSKTGTELISQGEWLAGHLKDRLYRESRDWGFEVTKTNVALPICGQVK